MSVLVERADGTPLAESPATPSRRKTRSATAEAAAAGRVMYVKGAPEAVLERCSYIRDPSHPDRVTPLTPHLRSRIAGKLLEWADQDALRVLAFACVDRPSLKEGLQIEPQQYINYEKDMTFVGLVGMLDPPRPEVIASVRRCHDAGVRVIVITGDNKNTAEAICKQIGVFPMDANLEGHSYTGREFDDMTEEQQKSAIRRANLFSRTEPAHKQKLVDLLQQEGWVVAMVGWGGFQRSIRLSANRLPSCLNSDRRRSQRCSCP